MPPVDIRALLARHDGHFKDVEVREWGNLPGGRYQFKIFRLKDRAILSEDRDHRVRARVGLEVVSGPQPELVGRKTNKGYGIFMEDGTPDDVGLSILKSDLSSLGINVEGLTLKKAVEIIEQLFEQVVDGNVVEKVDDSGTPRTNIYLAGLAGGSKVAKAPGAKKKF